MTPRVDLIGTELNGNVVLFDQTMVIFKNYTKVFLIQKSGLNLTQNLTICSGYKS